MIGSAQHFPLIGPVPAKDIIELGLRSTAGLGQAACEAGNRLSALQMEALRAMARDGVRVTGKYLTNELAGEADPTVEAMRQAMDYWRTLAGLMATTQAEMAELMASDLRQIGELAEVAARKGGQVKPEDLPLAMATAAGASVLASAQAMCNQIAQSARQFVASSGIDTDLGRAIGSAKDPGQSPVSTRRRAA